MKKTIITSTLATTIALGGFAGIADNQADASEQSSNQHELAQKAQSNDSSLNNKPVQEGSYDFTFNESGFTYHFWSDGTNFGYDYKETGQSDNQKVAHSSSVAQTYNTNIDTNQYKDVNTSTYNESNQTQAQPSESGASESVNTKKAPQATQAPQLEQTSTPKVQTSQVSTSSQESTSKGNTGGSTKQQFLNAGGTEAMWQSIVMPESGGNPNAVNPAGYQGLGQTMESWGTGSVESQTKGMINYAKERYGSIDNAIAERQSQGWW